MNSLLLSGLIELGAYYKEHHLRPNPAKTQLTAFHLKNRLADRKLNVTWNSTKLDHTHSPVHTRPLTHLPKPLSEDACKTLLQKQPPEKAVRDELGHVPPHHEDNGDSAMLSVVEYCCPVWARSTHRELVDTTLDETCRLITGCIRPTAIPDLYVLSGIAPPEIRRSVHSQNERTKQLTDQ